MIEIAVEDHEPKHSAQERPASADALSGRPEPETVLRDRSWTALRPGMELGAFEIVEEVGRGGMGIVYKAKERALERTVALKVLVPGAGVRQVESGSRFLREAQMAAKLEHPNVVPVYSVGRSGDYLFIAMQFVRGRTLTQRLAEQGPMSVPDALKMARQVAGALGAAHQAGILHRDIKPGNILVDEDLTVKVTDFGLSKGMLHEPGITREGVYLGTPEYSSPEQCETTELDGRTDLYSLGVVLYQTLTGKVPHQGETALSVFRKIREEEPVPVDELNPEVPPSVGAIVRRLMAKRPEDRYASASELVRDIDRITGRPATETDRRESSFGDTVMVIPGSGRRLVWGVGIAAAALAAISAGLWWGLVPGKVPPYDTSSPIPGALATLGNVRVLVLDFRQLTPLPAYRWMEGAIPDMLLAALAQVPGVSVLERNEMLSAMKQNAGRKILSAPEGEELIADPSLEAVLGALQPQVLINGTYAVIGEQVQIQATSFCFAQTLGPARQRMGVGLVRGKPGDLFALIDELSSQVARQITEGLGSCGYQCPQLPASLFSAVHAPWAEWCEQQLAYLPGTLEPAGKAGRLSYSEDRREDEANKTRVKAQQSPEKKKERLEEIVRDEEEKDAALPQRPSAAAEKASSALAPEREAETPREGLLAQVRSVRLRQRGADKSPAPRNIARLLAPIAQKYQRQLGQEYADFNQRDLELEKFQALTNMWEAFWRGELKRLAAENRNWQSLQKPQDRSGPAHPERIEGEPDKRNDEK